MTTTKTPRRARRYRDTPTTGLPTTMRAAVIDGAGPPESLQLREVPVPPLVRDHVIIALDFAGVGSWDARLRAGAWGPVRPGTILGADGSGTIAAVGPGVEDFRAGERVYAYSYNNPDGGFYAEYVSVRSARVSRVPAQIPPNVAGAMPCVGLTALAGLRALNVVRDRTLAVFGASGGVGSLAVWLAAGNDATVIATARADAFDYVSKLGARHVLDPYEPGFDARLARIAPDGFDAALVTANGDALQTVLAHLRRGAPIGYPDGVEPEPYAPRHPAIPFDGEMTRAAFTRFNAAIGTRELPLRVTVFAFDRVVDAHRRLEQGHIVGKLALRIR